EDLAQNVFLKAWKKRHQMPPDKQKQWLMGIAKNEIPTWIRIRKNREPDQALVATIRVDPASEKDDEIKQRHSEIERQRDVLLKIKNEFSCVRDTMERLAKDVGPYKPVGRGPIPRVKKVSYFVSELQKLADEGVAWFETEDIKELLS